MRLDARDTFPSGMEEYLSHYGWHFSKAMCDWAISRMHKADINGNELRFIPWSKDDVDNLLKKYSITVNKISYDYVYVANMCKADYYGSSVIDDQRVALFIKDYIDDTDGYPELPFTRFYSDCVGSGNPINWGDML